MLLQKKFDFGQKSHLLVHITVSLGLQRGSQCQQVGRDKDAVVLQIMGKSGTKSLTS